MFAFKNTWKEEKKKKEKTTTLSCTWEVGRQGIASCTDIKTADNDEGNAVQQRWRGVSTAVPVFQLFIFVRNERGWNTVRMATT